MSEAEVPETGPVSVDDILAAIQQKNIAQAKSHFQSVMSTKINDTLENEKVKIASQIFNGVEIPEPGVVDAEEQEEILASEEEVDTDAELETEEEELDLESDVEAAFQEDEEEEDA